MLHQNLHTNDDRAAVKVAVVGANGAFARSFVCQATSVESLSLVGLCDRDVEALTGFVREIGYGPEGYAVVADAQEARREAAAGRLVISDAYEVVLSLGPEVLLEATGSPGAGTRVTERALAVGAHVVTVNKEADSVSGIGLNRLADDAGRRYEYAHGDQPRNLIDLITWAEAIGLVVVAAGKSSEYDYVYDPDEGTVSHLDAKVSCPQLGNLWQLGTDVGPTLAKRSELLRDLPQSTAPDYVEMNIVSNVTGMLPARPEFHYPLARITELADIYAPKDEGGLLEETAVLDVFNLLRRTDEPSFGGGVFVVVRAKSTETWAMLREKGHVVSRNGSYGCVYLPFHLMGLETVGSVLATVGSEAAPWRSGEKRRRATVLVEALRDFTKGETLEPTGSHHEIEGVRALLKEWTPRVGDAVPYHLVARSRLKRSVPAGALFTLDDLENPDSLLVDYWKTDRKDRR